MTWTTLWQAIADLIPFVPVDRLYTCHLTEVLYISLTLWFLLFLRMDKHPSFTQFGIIVLRQWRYYWLLGQMWTSRRRWTKLELSTKTMLHLCTIYCLVSVHMLSWKPQHVLSVHHTHSKKQFYMLLIQSCPSPWYVESMCLSRPQVGVLCFMEQREVILRLWSSWSRVEQTSASKTRYLVCVVQ